MSNLLTADSVKDFLCDVNFYFFYLSSVFFEFSDSEWISKINVSII